MDKKNLPDYGIYEKHYSSEALWDKLRRVGQKAGIKAVYAVLLIYYVATDSRVSFSERIRLFGVLGYFILPTDLIPDLAPVVGYSDDLAALLWALQTVWANVTPEIQVRAKTRLKEWFGEVKEKDLQLFD